MFRLALPESSAIAELKGIKAEGNGISGYVAATGTLNAPTTLKSVADTMCVITGHGNTVNRSACGISSGPPPSCVRRSEPETMLAAIILLDVRAFPTFATLPIALLGPDYRSKKTEILEKCTPNNAEARDFQDDLWYVFEPRIASCKSAIAAEKKQIAEQLGLTATTVSSRIRRLEDANQLRVVAVSDFAAHGYDVLMQLAIEVDSRPASEVAIELAEFPEVFAIHIVTGRYDIDALVVLRDFEDMSLFLLDRLGTIRGIRRITPSIAVDILRYQFDVAPIEGRN